MKGKLEKKEISCSEFNEKRRLRRKKAIAVSLGALRFFFLLLYLKYSSPSFGYPSSDKTISIPEMYLGSKYPYWIRIVLTSGVG